LEDWVIVVFIELEHGPCAIQRGIASESFKEEAAILGVCGCDPEQGGCKKGALN
jgi:hypothetical protein